MSNLIGQVQQAQAGYSLQQNLQQGNYLGALQNAGTLYQTNQAAGTNQAQGGNVLQSLGQLGGAQQQPQAGGLANTLQQAQAGYSLQQNLQQGNYLAAAQNAGTLYQTNQGAQGVAGNQQGQAGGLANTLQQAQAGYSLQQNLQQGNYLAAAQNAGTLYQGQQGAQGVQGVQGAPQPTGMAGMMQYGNQGYQAYQQGNYGAALSNAGNLYNTYQGKPVAPAPQPAGGANPLSQLTSAFGVGGQQQVQQPGTMQAGMNAFNDLKNHNYGNALVDAGQAYASYSGKPIQGAGAQQGGLGSLFSNPTISVPQQPAKGTGWFDSLWG